MNDRKQFFKHLLVVISKNSQYPPILVSEDIDIFMLSPLELAQQPGNFFVSIGKIIASYINVEIDKASCLVKNSSSLFLNEVSASGFNQVLNDFAGTRATRIDNISIRTINPTFTVLLLHDTQFFSCSRSSSTFPIF